MQNQIKSAISLYSSGQPKDALNIIDKLMDEFPNEPILHNISGACYSALGQIEDAIDSYNEAIIIKPDYAEVHNSLGVILQSRSTG